MKKVIKRIISVILAGTFMIGSISSMPVSEVMAEETEGSGKDVSDQGIQSEQAVVVAREDLTQQVRHRNIKVTAVDAGSGEFSKTMTFSVPRRSSGSYSDTVSWTMSPVKSTGAGRSRSGSEQIMLNSYGNSAEVRLDHLLDYEEYQVTVKYSQTYYWDESHSWTYKDEKGEEHTEYYTTMESATTSGTLNESYTTPKDRYIRDASDLSEKVHKYPDLSLTRSIDSNGAQCIVDGKNRREWLSESDISTVHINGNGRRVKRSGEGTLFLVIEGASLSLENIYVDAYSGDIISTPTDGGEYITENASGGTEGVGILVGFDETYDGRSTTSGTLSLINSEVSAGRSALVMRYGRCAISSSTLYGMGDKDVYRLTGTDGYYGTGLGLINSYAGHSASASVSADSSIYGRFNGVYIQGNASLDISESLIRGDCGDAFDFRGSGSLDISECIIEGVKGIDVFHDAAYHGIYEALDTTSGRFNSSIFRRHVLPDRKNGENNGRTKGTVNVRSSSINVLTGPFSGMAGTRGAGIQNHGDISIGKDVTICVRHSGAWQLQPAGSRAVACGLWNSKKIVLPDDIVIYSDDTGIDCTRDMDTLRQAMNYYHDMGDEEIDAIERQAVSDERIFDDIDDGIKSSLTVTGGIINGADSGIVCTYGHLMIEPETAVNIYGGNTGVSAGKNKTDNIYGDDAMHVPFQINGKGTTSIKSSLQGTGIIIKRSARGEFYSDLDISGISGKCGCGIMNYGLSQMKNAVISACEYGIRNCLGGNLTMGDELAEENDLIEIDGAIHGIYNSGKLIYYRNVAIKDSKKDAVFQNGLFYMLAGSVVEPDATGHNVIYLNPGHTVRFFYDESEESLIGSTKGTFLTRETDRDPGRVMAELYSPWGAGGGIDYSQETYDGLSDEEKISITEQMSGFDLAFDKVYGHTAGLRSGLGKYKDEDTNGRTGTLVLSCLLEASYEADLPVKNDHFSSEDPEKTLYYWREPTEFMVASDLYETDRSRIFYDGRDVTAGLKQTGWRDRNADGGYGDEIYSGERITRIYGDDHTFCGVWDSRFTFLFDGNGQTNGAKNYQERNIVMAYTFPGNTGPEKNQKDYFRKSVKKNNLLHPVAYEGWSLDEKAVYSDNGIFREGHALRDSIGLYAKALDMGNVSFKDDEALVRIYAVWDEYPVITAYDSYFYADELSDPDDIRRRLLNPDTVNATDLCDGDIPDEQIGVYTDPSESTFDIEVMKNLGDVGSVNVYYRASDNNGHTSVCTARAHIMSEDAEDTTDDISHDGKRGLSGSSADTLKSAPVYVRNIDSHNKKSLIAGSVWREDEYDAALDKAFGDSPVEKWKFNDDDIKATRQMLYDDRSDLRKWRQRFLSNRTAGNIVENDDHNKPLFVETGLSSLRVMWDLKSETDRIELTLTAADGSRVNVPAIIRTAGKRMQSSVAIDSLKPGMSYDIAADFYYKGKYVRTLSQTARTQSLENPETEFSCEDTGDSLKVKIAIRSDRNASGYIVERREVCEGTAAWVEAGKVKNTGDDLLIFNETLKRQSVYKYRVKSEGSQIGKTDLSETSDYSDYIETAFIKRPVIKDTAKGCRSLGVTFDEKSPADYIRVFYRADNGALMHTDYHDAENIVISDARLLDGRPYELSAHACIRSVESGRLYKSLMSETKTESTYDLKAPVIKKTAQKDIYSTSGNSLEYETDEHASEYRIMIRRLFPDESEKRLDDIDGSGYYIHTPDRTGLYEYIIRADFKTLDGKEFYIDSEKVRAAYIRPQQAISRTVDEGTSEVVYFDSDPDASGYMIRAEMADGSLKKIYVPGDASRIIIHAIEKMKIIERRAVLFYEGKEYTGCFLLK